MVGKAKVKVFRMDLKDCEYGDVNAHGLKTMTSKKSRLSHKFKENALQMIGL